MNETPRASIEAINATRDFAAMTQAHFRQQFYVGSRQSGILSTWLLSKIAPSREVLQHWLSPDEEAMRRYNAIKSIAKQFPPGNEQTMIADFARAAGMTYFIKKAEACLILHNETFQTSGLRRFDLLDDASLAVNRAAELGQLEKTEKRQLNRNFKNCRQLPVMLLETITEKQHQLEAALTTPRVISPK